jgi:hypothetical protein
MKRIDTLLLALRVKEVKCKKQRGLQDLSNPQPTASKEVSLPTARK